MKGIFVESLRGALVRILRMIIYIIILIVILFLIGFYKQSKSPNIYARRSLYEILFKK